MGRQKKLDVPIIQKKYLWWLQAQQTNPNKS